MHRGTVSVEFETKEGLAIFDKDLKHCKGVLVSHLHRGYHSRIFHSFHNSCDVSLISINSGP